MDQRQGTRALHSHCALLLLTIYHHLIGRLLRGGYVSADETTVKLLDPDRRHNAQDAWLWTYLGPTVDTIIFQFSLTRGAENPQALFPKDWRGALQVDGYGVYASLARSCPGIVLFGCWTHARRGVVEALKSGEQKPLPLLREINELYAIETEAAGFPRLRTSRFPGLGTTRFLEFRTS